MKAEAIENYNNLRAVFPEFGAAVRAAIPKMQSFTSIENFEPTTARQGSRIFVSLSRDEFRENEG